MLARAQLSSFVQIKGKNQLYEDLNVYRKNEEKEDVDEDEEEEEEE